MLTYRRRAINIGGPALVTKVLIAAGGLFQILYARTLPVGEFASYAIARTLLMIAMVLGGGYLATALTRYAASAKGLLHRKLINTSLLLASASVTVIVTLLLLAEELIGSYYTEIELSGLFIWIALFLLLHPLDVTAHSALRAGYRTRQIMLSELLRSAVQYGLTGYLILTGALRSAEQILQIMLLGKLVMTAVNTFFARDLLQIGAGIDREHVRKILAFAKFSLGASFIYILYSRIDVLMLGKLASPDQVAAYSACKSLTSVTQTLNAAANMLVLPMIARMWDSGRYKSIMPRILTIILLIQLLQIPFVAVYLGIPGRTLSWIFSGKYDFAVTTLQTMVLIMFIRPFLSIISSTSAAMSKPVYPFVSTIFTGALNIGLNSVLIPAYQATGAVYATIISMTVGALLVSVLLRRHLGRAGEVGGQSNVSDGTAGTLDV